MDSRVTKVLATSARGGPLVERRTVRRTNGSDGRGYNPKATQWAPGSPTTT